jgi:hypothetical protein
MTRKHWDVSSESLKSAAIVIQWFLSTLFDEYLSRLLENLPQPPQTFVNHDWEEGSCFADFSSFRSSDEQCLIDEGPFLCGPETGNVSVLYPTELPGVGVFSERRALLQGVPRVTTLSGMNPKTPSKRRRAQGRIPSLPTLCLSLPVSVGVCLSSIWFSDCIFCLLCVCLCLSLRVMCSDVPHTVGESSRPMSREDRKLQYYIDLVEKKEAEESKKRGKNGVKDGEGEEEEKGEEVEKVKKIVKASSSVAKKVCSVVSLTSCVCLKGQSVCLPCVLSYSAYACGLS